MSDKPLISVIVPVYNSGEFIERCLKSLAAQTYDNIEIITADDGSADDSGEICRGFAGSDRRFRYIRRENSGVAAARNGGLSEARGELIGFCDSDDHIEPEMFEYLAELIERYNADISQCGAMIEFEDKPSREFKPESDILIEDFKNADKNALKLYHNAVWCKLFRRETIDGVKFESAFPIGEDLRGRSHWEAALCTTMFSAKRAFVTKSRRRKRLAVCGKLLRRLSSCSQRERRGNFISTADFATISIFAPNM